MQDPSKPNIIFVLADDLGIDGVSCYGADKQLGLLVAELEKLGLRQNTLCSFSPVTTAPRPVTQALFKAA